MNFCVAFIDKDGAVLEQVLVSAPSLERALPKIWHKRERWPVGTTYLSIFDPAELPAGPQKVWA